MQGRGSYPDLVPPKTINSTNVPTAHAVLGLTAQHKGNCYEKVSEAWPHVDRWPKLATPKTFP